MRFPFVLVGYLLDKRALPLLAIVPSGKQREAYGVRGACSRFRRCQGFGEGEKRQQAGRTPHAPRGMARGKSREVTGSPASSGFPLAAATGNSVPPDAELRRAVFLPTPPQRNDFPCGGDAGGEGQEPIKNSGAQRRKKYHDAPRAEGGVSQFSITYSSQECCEKAAENGRRNEDGKIAEQAAQFQPSQLAPQGVAE